MQVPCAGFGFGDCVIYELLKEKQAQRRKVYSPLVLDLSMCTYVHRHASQVLPELPHKVDFVVAAFNQDMMGKAPC